jgi:phthiocerol/phenolphthiocerol synthesis type-I polyketide synthase E
VNKTTTRDTVDRVAVIGMTGRYPGAKNLEQYWENLHQGRECITFFSDEELLEAGIDAAVLANPNYIKAHGMYEGTHLFDAGFFGYMAREAEIIDPQQRVFLECTAEALENAGYDPTTYPGRIGLFAGVGFPEYLFQHFTNAAVRRSVGTVAFVTSNEKDYIATRVGYKLDLRGPCVTVQTACSTSLVAIVLACQSLLNYQSEICMAGGVRLTMGEKSGYIYDEGGIVSPDGHCRTFDAAAKGTVFSCGAGVVVLKRLEDALADGDTVHAVVLGFGLNNDGSAKVGFTAPGVDGQVAVSSEALAMAGVDPETIDYIECHGTGTAMGDPIEIAALSRSFQGQTNKKHFCALGSVKTNIGHTDAAAGVAGFTKVVLSLKNKLIPASLNFSRPNPQIDFENSPFYVNTKLAEWKNGGHPRRAGLNSFGIGGTNAHVILEEAPPQEASSPSPEWQILPWSTKTPTALEKSTENLLSHLKKHSDEEFADIAYTLQVGRRLFQHRRFVVGRDRADVLQAFEDTSLARVFTADREVQNRPVAFLFPGQGSQYPNMGKELYATEAVFRENVDLCALLLKPHLNLDLRALLYPDDDQIESATRQLGQTANTQPALFAIEYALARLWMHWGIQPEGMIGHSIGEYVAACLAGVFSLEEALKLVATRGRLMQQLPAGAMLGVMLPENETRSLISSGSGVSIAAVNGPSACVVSGSLPAVDQFEQLLVEKKAACRRLHTSHAFHSEMMDPILGAFGDAVRAVELHPPVLPYVSNVSGTWITAAEAIDPAYWVRHLRHSVRFADGAAELLKDKACVCLEVGPGNTLTQLIAQHPAKGINRPILPSLPHPKNDPQKDREFALTTAGKLWIEGVHVNWAGMHSAETRHRIALPTYPFERADYRISVDASASAATGVAQPALKKTEVDDWFYEASWKRTAPLQRSAVAEPGRWLIFSDHCGIGVQIEEELKKDGHDVIRVTESDHFSHNPDGSYSLNPASRDDYSLLLQALTKADFTLTDVAHLWQVTERDHPQSELQCVDGTMDRGFYSLLYLVQALSTEYSTIPLQVHVVTSDAQEVCGEAVPCPSKAAVVGVCRTIVREYENIDARCIDVQLTEDESSRPELARILAGEFGARSRDEVIAYRSGQRWVPTVEQFHFTPEEGNPRLRENGVYLITGGLGGIGLALAEYLAKTVKAKLVMVGRSAFPTRSEWDEWLRAHGEEESVSQKIRQLLKLEELGSEVLVLSADVASLESMRVVFSATRQKFNALHGVIHSAGVGGDGIIELKSREAADQVLGPKIKGTLVLEELLKGVELDFFVLCSSLASVVGAGGQVDYTGANAFLDAFAHSRKSSKNSAPIAINWDRWDETGMAADRIGKAVSFKKIESMPGYQVLDHPIFVGSVKDYKREIHLAYLNPDQHWIVGEHRLKGTATVVGTAYLELARAAFLKDRRDQPVQFRDVVFMTPLMVAEGEQKETHVIIGQSQGQLFDFQVRSRVGESGWQDHVAGKIGFAKEQSPVRHDIAALLARCSTPTGEDHSHATSLGDQATFIQFGERWNNMLDVRVGTNECVALLQLPEEYNSDLRSFDLHPALLDSATAFAITWAGKGSVYLPFGYNNIVVTKPLPSKLYSHARFEPATTKDEELISFDLVLMDEEGNELVKIDGYNLKRVPDAFLNQAKEGTLAMAQSRPGPALLPAKANKKRDLTTERILPPEGVEVFRRILGLKGMPQVVIASKDYEVLALETMPLRDRAKGKGGKNSGDQVMESAHPRPNLLNPYVAPRNQLERALADIWQTVLGIDQIGAHDSFMDLGGHSLLAIQLASRIRELFEIELSVATLYKTPTVAGLTEAIVQDMVSEADNETLVKALEEADAEKEAVA